MLRWGPLVMLAASLAVLAHPAPLSAAGVPGDAPACGAPGKPPCPLQRWMRQHMAAPLALRDHPRLAEAFQRLERLNPAPGEWSEWQSLARRGQLAAREGDTKGARATCGSCHREYRQRYRARYRTLPTGGTGD